MPLALIEFPADDPHRARGFWSALLGIELEARTAGQGDGWQSSGAPALGIHTRGAGPGDTRSLPYFEIEDPMPDALGRVTQLGGTVIHPGASWAICRDSEGNPFALSRVGAPDDGFARESAGVKPRTDPSMPFLDPPSYAAWQHRNARNGFEVVFLSGDEAGHRFAGTTAAVEGGEPWVVHYEIRLGPDWRTRSAYVTGHSGAAARSELTLESNGAGCWRIDGVPADHLDGCLDVDLEASALTNAFPVHRLGLQIGTQGDAPAAYVRAVDLSVERLEQRYVRLDDDGAHQKYRYAAPSLEFECDLLYDDRGLLLDYPGLATRAS
jgi:predicted enzyme related to lactoylglutathione lyase